MESFCLFIWCTRYIVPFQLVFCASCKAELTRQFGLQASSRMPTMACVRARHRCGLGSTLSQIPPGSQSIETLDISRRPSLRKETPSIQRFPRGYTRRRCSSSNSKQEQYLRRASITRLDIRPRRQVTRRTAFTFQAAWRILPELGVE